MARAATTTTKRTFGQMKRISKNPAWFIVCAQFWTKRQILFVITNTSGAVQMSRTTTKRREQKIFWNKKEIFIWNCSHETKCKVDIFLILWFYWCWCCLCYCRLERYSYIVSDSVDATAYSTAAADADVASFFMLSSTNSEFGHTHGVWEKAKSKAKAKAKSKGYDDTATQHILDTHNTAHAFTHSLYSMYK